MVAVLVAPQRQSFDLLPCSPLLRSGELFDFDAEVEPLLEVLVGKVLEQSLMEVLEEEELAAMKAHQVKGGEGVLLTWLLTGALRNTVQVHSYGKGTAHHREWYRWKDGQKSKGNGIWNPAK